VFQLLKNICTLITDALIQCIIRCEFHSMHSITVTANTNLTLAQQSVRKYGIFGSKYYTYFLYPAAVFMPVFVGSD
jgi:hypothetical protein